MDISKIKREATEKEMAEDRRRWEKIQAGRHPDTGEVLRPGDETTLKLSEQARLRMQRDWNLSLHEVLYPSAMSCIMQDLLEQERLWALYVERTRREERMQHVPEPLADTFLPSLPFEQILHRQVLLDAVYHGSQVWEAQASVNMLERQHRYLDPLLDINFVNRLTGGVDNDLIRRATVLHEIGALRAVREQVENAASIRMMDQWRAMEVARRHTEMPTMASAFTSDAAAMASEAQRMLATYGPTIAEHAQFLSEYHANLAIFPASRLTTTGFERADLLARLALPMEFAVGLAGYHELSLRVVRSYGEAVIRELKADFARDGNPVFAWEALAVARRYHIDLPEWLIDFIADVADRILDIRNEVAEGKPVRREAERVGKALGFGNHGPGHSGWFKHATILERDRCIFFEVRDRLRAGTKLDFAYDEVAKAQGVSRSTVVRTYLRIRKLSEETLKQDDGEDEVS